MKRKLKLFITLALCFLTLGLVFAGCGKSDSGEESTKSESHSIVIDDEIRFGTVVADKTSANSGETVNLTVHPDISYTLKPGSLKYSTLANNGSSATTINGLSFKMPAYDIKITAEFEKIKYDITVPSQQTGYQIVSLDDRPIQNLKIEHGSALIFKINLDAAHNQSTPVVKQNGSVMTPDLNGVYRTIVTGNISLSVENIELNVYTIIFQDENGNTISSKSDYHHGDVVIKPADQTKESENPDDYTWIFEGWRDANNVLTTISTVTGNATYHPSFVRADVEYTLTIPNNVSVTKGGTAQTSASTLHYGDLIVITYTPSQGMFMNEFAVSGATSTANENEYTVTGNVTITYTESSAPRADSLEKLVFIYDNVNSTASVKAANTSISGEVIIPASVYNSGNIYTVTSIPADGFRNCTSITRVIIPGSISTIAANSFRDCTSLTSVTFEEGVQEVKNDAFLGCLVLLNVLLPRSINKLGENSLRSTVSGTGPDMSVFYGGTLAEYFDIVFDDYWILSNWTLYVNDTAISSLEIPSGVTTIPNNAFYHNSGITSVTMPASVQSIGTKAFTQCTNMLSIVIGSGVTSIGAHAFKNCSGLTSVTIPGSVTTIETNTFRDCTSLASVIIDNGVQTIGDEAFLGCVILSNVTLPASITSIGVDSLRSTTGGTGPLMSIYYGGTLTEYLTTINFGEHWVVGNWTIYINNTAITALEIPSGVTSIPNWAFYFNAGITSVTMPASVNSIGTRAFMKCSSLETAIIGSDVTTISDAAFRNCPSLTTITIPANITTIAESAFKECSNLTTVTFENPNGWMAGSTALSASDLANPSTAATYLTSTYLSQIWTRNDANYLTFTPDDNSNPTSYSVSAPATIYGSNIDIVIPSTYNGLPVTAIPESSFQGRTMISSIVIPSSVTSIGTWAFKDCANLASVTINEGLLSIGLGAFRDSGITTITIPASVTTIVTSAFEDCDSLVDVTFAEGSTLDLPSGIFIRCDTLQTVTLASTMDQFSNKAFNQSNELTTIIWNNKIIMYAPNGFDSVFEGTSTGAVFIEDGYDSSILAQLNVDVSDMGVYTLTQIIAAYNSFVPYLFSETEPQTAGNYWHYVNGIPAIWE